MPGSVGAGAGQTAAIQAQKNNPDFVPQSGEQTLNDLKGAVGSAAQAYESGNVNPFATFGEEKSNWAKGLDAFLTVARDISYVPVKAMEAIGHVQATLLDRPVATLFQSITPDNPMYTDGLQWDDIKTFWNSTDLGLSNQAIGTGRSFVNFLGTPGRLSGQKDGYANYLGAGIALDPDFDPYHLTDEQKKDLNNNAVYNLGTGFADLGYDVAAGFGVTAGGRAAGRAAGLARSARDAQDLQGLKDAIDIHQDPANPDVTAIGTQVDNIAASRDLTYIKTQGVAAGIKDPGLLFQLQRETDPVTVGLMVRAARGDLEAIGRLTKDQPDIGWTVLSAREKLSKAIMEDDYNIAQDPSGQMFLEGAHEAMVSRDASLAVQRELFWQKATKAQEEAGVRAGEYAKSAEGDFVPTIQTTRLPAGTGTNSVLNKVIGQQAAKVQGGVRTAYQVAQGADWLDTPKWMTTVLGVPGITPTLRLIAWSGHKTPNGVVSLSPTRPGDAANEMISQMNDMTAWRNLKGNRKVTFIRDGQQVAMTRAERAADVQSRLVQASVEHGEVGMVNTIRAIEEENLSVLFHQRGRGLALTNDDFDKIVQGVVAGSNRGHGRVGMEDIVTTRDGKTVGTDPGTTAPQGGGGGYYVDVDGTKVDVDPNTLRGLANTWVTLPMRRIEDGLVSYHGGLKGRAKDAQIVGREVREITYGVARATMLMRLGYIPKNSMADPAFARFLALGEVAGPDGILTTAQRAAKNWIRRGIKWDDALRRGLIPSTRVGRKDAKIAELHAQRRDYDDELVNLKAEKATLQSATDPVLAQRRAEIDDLIRHANRKRDNLLGILDVADPGHRLSAPQLNHLTDIQDELDTIGKYMEMPPEEAMHTLLTDFRTWQQSMEKRTADDISIEQGQLSNIYENWRLHADGRSEDGLPIEDLVPYTLQHIDDIVASRASHKVDLEARLADIGIPRMPFWQHVVQNLDVYMKDHLPADFEQMSKSERRQWLSEFYSSDENFGRVWGRNPEAGDYEYASNVAYPGRAIDDGSYSNPADQMSDSTFHGIGTRVYRAMGQDEYDRLAAGNEVDGITLGSKGDEKMAGLFWAVEGSGREGSFLVHTHDQGGFGSFYDRESHPIVVEMVLDDPKNQIVSRAEKGKYNSNIETDYEVRVRPGAYIRVSRAWKAENPSQTAATHGTTTPRVPIRMDPTKPGSESHWTPMEVQPNEQRIGYIQGTPDNLPGSGGTPYAASHRIGDRNTISTTDSGSWLRDLDQTNDDLARAIALKHLVNKYMDGTDGPEQQTLRFVHAGDYDIGVGTQGYVKRDPSGRYQTYLDMELRQPISYSPLGAEDARYFPASAFNNIEAVDDWARQKYSRSAIEDSADDLRPVGFAWVEGYAGLRPYSEHHALMLARWRAVNGTNVHVPVAFVIPLYDFSQEGLKAIHLPVLHNFASVPGSHIRTTASAEKFIQKDMGFHSEEAPLVIRDTTKAPHWFDEGTVDDNWLQDRDLHDAVGSQKAGREGPVVSAIEDMSRTPHDIESPGAPAWASRGTRWRPSDRDQYDAFNKQEKTVMVRYHDEDKAGEMYDEWFNLQEDHKKAQHEANMYSDQQNIWKREHARRVSAFQDKINAKHAEITANGESMSSLLEKAGKQRAMISGLRKAMQSGEGKVWLDPKTGKTVYANKLTVEQAAAGGYVPVEDAFSTAPGIHGDGFQAETSMSHTIEVQNDPFGMNRVRRRQDRMRRTVGAGRAIPMGDPFYFDALENVANRQVRGDFLGEAMLRGADDQEIARLLDTPEGVDYRKRMRWDEDPVGQEALAYPQDDASLLHYRTNKIRNLRDIVDTYFPKDMPIPGEILSKYGMDAGTDLHTLISQHPITRGEFEQIMGGSGRDLRVIHGNDWEAETRSVGEKLADAQQSLWEAAMVKPETRMGSNPAAVSFYRQAMGRRAKILESQGYKVTGDELNGMIVDARREAFDDMAKTIYHIDRNPRFIRAASVFSAFPAAYVNAVTRYTGLMLRNPGRAGLVNRAVQTNTDPESWWWTGDGPQDVQVLDQNGNLKDGKGPLQPRDRVLLGVPEWMRDLMPEGMKDGITITPDALALFGQAPSLHPYVGSVVGSTMDQARLESLIGKGTANELFPFGIPKGPIQQALPGWLGGAASELDITAAEVNRQLTADYITWAKNGSQGAPPTWEGSEQRLRDGALMRFAVKFAAPGGAAPTKEGSLAFNTYRNLMVKYNADQTLVQAEWSKMFPEVPVPSSATEYGVYGYIPSTTAAKATLEGNLDLVRQAASFDPNLVSVLTIGDKGNQSDSAVSQWLRDNTFAPGADPYVSDKDPVSAAADKARQQGWVRYKEEKAKFDQYLVSQNLTSGMKAAQPAVDQWKGWLNEYGSFNPVWKQDYLDGVNKKAPGVILTLRNAINSPTFMAQHADNATWKQVGYFLNEYERAKNAYRGATTSDERKNVVGIFDQWVNTNLADPAFASLYGTYLDDGRALEAGGY